MSADLIDKRMRRLAVNENPVQPQIIYRTIPHICIRCGKKQLAHRKGMARCKQCSKNVRRAALRKRKKMLELKAATAAAF
ncbi:MAG: hypothetical protein OYH77_00950 [Pseudomonadota bacterium]|nr:hypothetical protein [Pseudomonadota bacterium]